MYAFVREHKPENKEIQPATTWIDIKNEILTNYNKTFHKRYAGKFLPKEIDARLTLCVWGQRSWKGQELF